MRESRNLTECFTMMIEFVADAVRDEFVARRVIEPLEDTRVDAYPRRMRIVFRKQFAR